MIKLAKKFILFGCFYILSAYIFSKIFNTLFPFKFVSKYFDLQSLHTLEGAIVSFAWVVFSLTLSFIFVKIFRREWLNQNKQEKQHIEKLVPDSAQAEEIMSIFDSKCRNEKALMIIGEWGYGKTSFYKKSLKPILKKRSRNLVEISCFGIQSTNDIINQILDKEYLLEIWGVFFNYARQFLTHTTQFKQGLVPKGLTIVIDDFERSARQESNDFFIELLGLVNYLINNKKCHIIILCNETHIEKYKHYKDFTEKAVERYMFQLTPEILEGIIMSDCFEFNKTSHYFNEKVIRMFLDIVSVTRNMRIASGAHKDWKRLAEKLIQKSSSFGNKFQTSDEEINMFLQDYFNTASGDKIKAVFIKNAHLEKEALDCRSKYVNSAQKNYNEKFSGPDNPYLRKLGSISLGEGDTCMNDGGLYLRGSSEIYLQNQGDLFETSLCEILFVEWLFKCLQLEMELTIDDLTAIKNGFIRIFECIITISIENTEDFFSKISLNIFLLYKLFNYKHQFNLCEKESNVISKIEDILKIENIKNALRNMTDKKPYLIEWSPSLVKNKLQAQSEWIKEILKTYECQS